jgi:hypothetical protein
MSQVRLNIKKYFLFEEKTIASKAEEYRDLTGSSNISTLGLKVRGNTPLA